MFWRRSSPASVVPRSTRETVSFEDLTRRARKRIMAARQADRLAALTGDIAARRGTPIPDRDIVVAETRARRAAQQEQ